MSDAKSLDDPVDSQSEGRGNRHAKRPGGLEVDDEFELVRLLKGKVAGPRAFQDLVDVACGTAERVRHVRRIGHESAGFYILPNREHRRQPVLGRELYDHGSVRGREWADDREERVRTLLRHRGERAW